MQKRHQFFNKQASLIAMSPKAPFYLLDDGTTAVPPLFYALINKALAVPLLLAWSDHLWQTGRAHNLIQPLNDGAGQGYAAWRVLPDAEGWQTILQTGLQCGCVMLTATARDLVAA